MEIRCSGLARPMVCPGFVYLDLHKVKAGPAAENGTAAGEHLERLLTGQSLTPNASNGVYIDDDMKFHGQNVYDHIMSRVHPKSKVLCETRIDWMTRSGIKIRGQYDICFVDREGRLCIEDLKYGWGIVEVKENWQLLGYAIGEMIRLGRPFEEVSFKIHQPRPHHENGPVREWLITYQELLDYKGRIETRMQEIMDGKNELRTSDKCKYCKGAAQACPAFSRLFYRALEITTEFHQDSLTDEELAAQLDQVKRAKEVIKIKEDSLNELGALRIKQGQIIPGYVVSEKYGHRAWKKGVSPEAIQMMTNKDITETNVMSPSKAEKLGVSKDLVKQLSEKRFLGVKLEKKNSTEIGNKIFGTTDPNGGN